MEYHSKISFFRTPSIWLKDKYNTGLNQKSIYFVASIPGIFVIFGLIASWITISKASGNSVTLVLAVFLFIYGLLNLILVIVLQRAGVRLDRERKNYRTMHKNIIEIIREYRAERKYKERQNNPLTEEEIKERIKTLLSSFNDNYMKPVHRRYVSVTVKYLKNKKLLPIRVGGDIDKRDYEAENSDNAFVYRALNEPGRKLRYIYVKNIDNPDKYECEVLGKYKHDIQRRAKLKYNTFIALPIRAGRLIEITGDFSTKPDLGILGFDLKEKYGFGNFESHELDYLACFADLLSEPLQDLVECGITRNGEEK